MDVSGHVFLASHRVGAEKKCASCVTTYKSDVKSHIIHNRQWDYSVRRCHWKRPNEKQLTDIVPFLNLEHILLHTLKPRGTKRRARSVTAVAREEGRGGQVATLEARSGQATRRGASGYALWRTCEKLLFFFFFSLVFIVRVSDGWTIASPPLITYQVSRFGTPRGRATQPGRDAHMRRGAHAPPLRAPSARAREKTAGRKRNRGRCAKTAMLVHVRTSVLFES